MKVDLDELERAARSVGDAPVCGPSTTLALVARIRELENALDSWGDYSRYADKIRAMILKGVTFP